LLNTFKQYWQKSVDNLPELAQFSETLRSMLLKQGKKLERFASKNIFEAGGMFDNSWLDNCFDLVQQCKNRLGFFTRN
jgi:hypothetical protein